MDFGAPGSPEIHPEPECAAVERRGELEHPGLMEYLVHYSPPDAPVDPNIPSDTAVYSSEIMLLTLAEQLRIVELAGYASGRALDP